MTSRKPYVSPIAILTLAALLGACSDDTNATGGNDTGDTGAADSTTGDPTVAESSTGASASITDTADSSSSASASATDTDTASATDTDTASATDGSSSSGGVTMCGDDVAEGAEACDGTDLLGEDCGSLGFDGGRLACDARCAFDTSGCTTACGNGVLDDGEACDGTEFGAEDCVSQGHSGGELSCAADCTIDDSACVDALCGNGVAEDPESCDGVDLGLEDCISMGFDGGEISCDDACAYDTSTCTGLPNCCEAQPMVTGCSNMDCQDTVCAADGYCCDTEWDDICVGEAFQMCPDICVTVCGDGFVGGDEACDGDNFGGQTCDGLGLPSGQLACDDTCALDTTGCNGLPGPCCSANAVPGCEDAGCQDAICAVDGFCCDTQWDGQCAAEAAAEPACLGLSNCVAPTCGDGVVTGDEVCDGMDLGGESCASQGVGSDCCIPSGGLGCDDDACETAICAFDAFCCDTQWDGQCAGEAADTCADLCSAGTLVCNVSCDGFDTSGC